MIDLNKINFANLNALFESPDWVEGRRSGRITPNDLAAVLAEAQKRIGGELPKGSTSAQLTGEMARLSTMQAQLKKQSNELETLNQLMGEKPKDEYVKSQSKYIARQEALVEQQVKNMVSRLAAMRDAHARTKMEAPKYVAKEKDAMPFHMAAKDKAISWTVNEFVSRFFTQSGEFSPNTTMSPEAYWDHFVKNAFIAKSDGYSPNIRHDALAAVKAAQKRFNSNSGATKHYSHFKYDSQVAHKETLKVATSTLYSADKSHAVVFAPDRKNEILAISAAKMMELNAGVSKVEMLTPSGSKIFTRADVYNHMTRKSKTSIEAELAKSARNLIGSGKEKNYYKPLSTQQAFYNTIQDSLAKSAKHQLVSLALAAVGSDGLQKLEDFKKMKVEKLKGYGEYFGDTYSTLKAYTKDDRRTLGEVLGKDDLFALERLTLQKSTSEQDKYEKAATRKAERLGGILGVYPKAITDQLQGKSQVARLDSLKSINAFLSESVQDVHAHNKVKGTNLGAQLLWAKKFPKRNSFAALINSSNPKFSSSAVDMLIKNMSNTKFLQDRGLLDDSAANPILNLKGYTQERFIKLLAEGTAKIKVPYKASAKDIIKPDSAFFDTLAKHKLGHMDSLFQAAAENLADKASSPLTLGRNNKPFKGSKFAKYPSKLIDERLDLIPSLTSKRAARLDLENNGKIYEASNWATEVASMSDELGIDMHGNTTGRDKEGYQSRLDRDLAKSKVESRLLGDNSKEDLNSILSDFDLDSLVDKEMKAIHGADYNIKAGESIRQRFFGTTGDNLSMFKELKTKIATGSISFEEHEQLTQIAKALGVASPDGTTGGMQKTLRKLSSLEKDYFDVQQDKEAQHAGVYASKYIKWAATNGYVANLDSNTKGILESQYKQALDLGLIDIKEGPDGKPFADFSKLTNNKDLGMFIGTKEAMDDMKATVSSYLDPSNDGESKVDDARRTAILQDIEKTKYPSNYLYQMAKAIKAGKADKSNVIDTLFTKLRLGSDMAEAGTLKGSGYARVSDKVTVGPKMASDHNELAKVAMYYKNPAVKDLADTYVGRIPIHGKVGYSDDLAIKAHELIKGLASKEIDFPLVDKFGNALGPKLQSVGTQLLTKYMTSGTADGFNTTKSMSYRNALNSFVSDISAIQGDNKDQKLRSLNKYNTKTGLEIAKDSYISGLKNVLVGGISAEDYIKEGSVQKRSSLVELALTAKALAEEDFDGGYLSGKETSNMKLPKMTYAAQLERYTKGRDPSTYKASLSGRAFDAENDYLTSVDKAAISGLSSKARTSEAISRPTIELGQPIDTEEQYQAKIASIVALAKNKQKARQGLFSWSPISRLNPLRLANGGKIPGKGSIDEVPALLMKGEVVIDRATSERLGIHTQADYDKFKKAVHVQKFSEGGPVDDDPLNILNLMMEEAKEGLAQKGSVVNEQKVPNVKPKSPVNGAQTMDDFISSISATANVTPGQIQDQIKALRGMSINQIREFVTSADYGKYTSAMGGNPLKAFANLATSENIRSLDTNVPLSSYFELDEATPMHPDEAKLLKTTTKGMFNEKGVQTAIGARTQSEYADMISQLASNSVEELSTMLKDPNQQARIFNALDKSKNKLLTPKAQQEYAKLQGTVIESVVGMSSDEFKTMIAKPGVELGSFNPNVQGNLNALAGNDNDYNRFKSLLGNDAKSLDGIMRPAEMTNLSKALNTINNNMESFNKLFGTNISKVSDQAGIDKVVQEVLANNKDGFKVSGRTSTPGELGAARNMLGQLGSTIDPTTKEGFETSNKLNEMGRQIGDSQSIRERSQMRWANFKELTVQNAAFAASYGVIGAPLAAISAGAGFIIELDDKLKNLQAITASTNPEMDKLGKAVKQVSVETKFSAGEIADAATILGQAGFSAQDIQDSLKGVAELATATGSNIEDATQTLTSALTVWDAPMRDSTKYANEFTAAINKSKLDINSLSLALQYAGNIAAEGGIPVEDVLTVTSLMKDAGIRQGSTVGTGQRLVYSDIIAPSAKFTESLAGVGVSKGDLKSKFEEEGILGALKLMKDSGYGMVQASSGMELREKSAYMAIVNQLDKAQLFKSGIIGTDAATQANDVQMQSLMNLGKNMINSWGVLLSDTIGSEFGGISKAMNALTYGGKNDKDGDGVEDKRPEIGNNIDYYEQANNTSGIGDTGAKVVGALGLAGAGYAGYKGFQAFQANKGALGGVYNAFKDSDGIKGKLGFIGNEARAAGGNIKWPGAVKGVGYLALFGEALNVMTSDNPEAAAMKSLPFLASMWAGAKVGAGLGGMTGTPHGVLIGGIAGGVGGALGYGALAKDSVDKNVDKAFGIQKGYKETVQTFNSSLESGASAMRDMYATRLDVQRTRNNPLAIQEDMTSAEKQQVKSTLNKYSAELNTTYKAQIEELKSSKVKDSMGKDFDFTYHAKDNMELAGYMKEFEDSYKNLQGTAVKKMNDAAIKTLSKETEFNPGKGTFEAQTSALREDIENLIATQARIDPNALTTMKATHDKAFNKYINNAVKAKIESLDEQLDDGDITKAQYDAEVKQTKATAKRQKETYAGTANNTILTAGLNLTRPEDILNWSKKIEGLAGISGITDQDVGKQQKALMENYNQSVINERPILAKAMEDIGELNSKFQEVNKTFKQFFRDARDSIGDQSVAMGRSSGKTTLAFASALGGNWEDLNGIKARAGKAGIAGLDESWMKDSPDNPEAKQYFKFMNSMAKIQPAVGLAQGAKEASAIEFKNIMSAQKIAQAIGTLPLTLEGVVSKFGEDPQMLKAFYGRQDKLEEMGLNRDVNIPQLMAMDTKSIATGPIEAISKLINPMMNKQMEFQKLMAIERLEVQHAEMVEANFGGKNVPYEQSEYAYAQKQREKQYGQSLKAQERQVEFQKANLVLNYQRSLEDMAAKSAFQRNEMAISYGNQVAGMARSYDFNRSMTVLQSGWQRADVMNSQEDNLTDIDRKKRYAIEDLNTGNRYKTEDANKNLERSLTNLALNFSRSTEAIQRAMAFTESMFERNMDKPVNVTLNPEAFMKVAIALNDTSLALDSHKAELAANTGAIQQLIGIQQGKENLAKEAYKSAYKAVGGEVYKEDGTVNEAFTNEYNQYMKSNSEQLLDTVLEQALSRTMSGTGFDVTSALTDPTYMANAVLNPGEATTTDSLVTGSGLSSEDIINALLGTASGEVRLTTTQGVVLEAQGDLGAALFDLQTQMIQYQNQITEAGIQYVQAITDAQQNLAYTLEDIGTAFGRGMESIQTAYLRDLEQAGETFNRQMEQITTNLDRNLTVQTLQYQFQLQEAAIRFRESLEALSRQEAFNREQLATSLQRALEDLANNTEFRLSEAAINNEQNEIAISEGFARLMEKANLANEAAVRAIEFQMGEAMRKAVFDAQTMVDMINRGLRQTLANQLPDMAFMITSFSKAIEKAAIDTEWKLGGVMASIAKGLEKVSNDPAVQEQFREVGGKSLKEILTGITSGMPTTVKSVIDAINEPINSKFKEGLGTISRGMVDAVEETAQGFGTAATKLQEPSSRMSAVFTSITEQSRIMLTSQGDLTRQTAAVAATAAQSMANAAAQIAAIKNQIAAQSSGTVYRSSGGVIPGFGGGDIVPAMLEPGEYVIRKEAVRALGEEALNRLNSGAASEFIQADLTKGSIEGSRVVQQSVVNSGANLSVGINVHPEMTIKSIQDNIEKIADGVHRVFQEYM